MPIKIYVESTANPGDYKEMSSKFAIKGDNVCEDNSQQGIGVSYNDEDGAIVISNYTGTGVYELALEQLETKNYLTSINSIKPASDGTFFITGSECTSVSSSLPEDYSSDTGRLTVVDMCPSCTNCSSYINILKQSEAYKILLNRIKDFNLYTRDIAAVREEFLVAKKIELQASCKAELEEDPLLDNLLATALSGDRLFKQYIATVHMWNYAVNMTGANTQLMASPEDPSSFVLQTMRALPSCNGELSVSVEILVHGPSTCNDDPVSIYVPEPMVNFVPEGSATPTPPIEVEHISASEKRLYIPETHITGAGSLCITARFLPFVAIKLTYDGKPISLDNFISDIVVQEKPDVEEEGFTTSSKVNKFSIEHESIEIIAPTINDYNTSRRYPSVTADTEPLRYSVDMVWTITGIFKDDMDMAYYDEKVIADTYYFDCRPLRKCVSNIWKDVESFSTLFTEDDTEQSSSSQ